MNPVDHVRRHHSELTAVRRDIHAHPELAFEESRTASLVAERLAGWGIEVHRGLAKTGVVGVVKGKGGGRGIGLRADMDCLPMHETNGFAHKSRNAGRMHACGHDGHTTMLLGAARYLAETRNFAGTVYLIFQPAEEGGGGGQVMVREGLFDKFPADEVYALHNYPGIPAGKMAVRPGPMMAATDELKITLRGTGGHGAFPHLAVDPVVAAAHVVTALQTVASRNVDPVDAVVVSVCSMATSQIGAFNVIPAALGARASVEYTRGYPATVNSARESELAARVGRRVFGADNVNTDFPPVMGGEDFSYMLQARPGAYVFLGQGGGPSACFLHNPGYDFNDEVIPLGAGYLAALAEEALAAE
jgi:metal-dependent amidase/aminoacylase/carboxypeptidase family protein